MIVGLRKIPMLPLKLLLLIPHISWAEDEKVKRRINKINFGTRILIVLVQMFTCSIVQLSYRSIIPKFKSFETINNIREIIRRISLMRKLL